MIDLEVQIDEAGTASRGLTAGVMTVDIGISIEEVHDAMMDHIGMIANDDQRSIITTTSRRRWTLAGATATSTAIIIAGSSLLTCDRGKAQPQGV